MLGGLLARVFGCRHKDLSRPFTRDCETYRMCLNCGAQRQFDARTWEMRGRYYHRPARVNSSIQPAVVLRRK
jgi:hypothetical protein